MAHLDTKPMTNNDWPRITCKNCLHSNQIHETEYRVIKKENTTGKNVEDYYKEKYYGECEWCSCDGFES